MPAKVITDLINKEGFWRNLTIKFATALMEHTASSRYKLFQADIIGRRILDVGVGAGAMSKIVINHGYDVVGIDVMRTSLYPDIVPTIYDGENIPLKTKYCDTGLLICVLHHCSKQIRVLEETMRLCRRIVIIEDTFRNNFEKMLISVRDSVGNLEFYQHEYHSTKDWLKIFQKRGWKSIKTVEWSSIEFYGMYGRQTMFVIEPA